MEKVRLEKGFTQTQVAEAVGVTAAFYNRVEHGFHVPNVVVGVKICEFLDIDVRKFLSERAIK